VCKYLNTLKALALIATLVFLGQLDVISAPASAAASDVVAHIHWLGKKAVAADTNAAGLMKIWNLPETARLQAEIVDKFSGAPWRLLRGVNNPGSTNLLRPLINDLIDDETFIEIRQPAGQPNAPGEMVVAIRMDDEHARLWNTNLATALSSLTNLNPALPRPSPLAPHSSLGWTLKKHHVPNLIQLGRAGEWTVLGAAHERNALFDETLSRLKREKSPFATNAGNAWLEADIDLPRVTAALGHPRSPLPNFPKITLTLTGDGQNVLTRGHVEFPEAIPLVLEPWNIPTNLIDADLYSFTAVRGWKPQFLSRFWGKFDTNPPPSQYYLWSLDGAPMQTYVAAPLGDASNAVSRLSDYLLRRAPPWLAAGELVGFQRAKTYNGLQWKGAPFISPFLKSTELSGKNFVVAGFSPLSAPSEPASGRLFQPVQDGSNLVYYHWESTGMQIQQLTYLIQFIRLLAGRPQLPAESPSGHWLNSMGAKLQASSTSIVHDDPRKFSFSRSSTVPFNALELQLLADWFESPDFPRGLHSTLATPPQ
jgi:hypothetical protein